MLNQINCNFPHFLNVNITLIIKFFYFVKSTENSDVNRVTKGGWLRPSRFQLSRENTKKIYFLNKTILIDFETLLDKSKVKCFGLDRFLQLLTALRAY